MIFCILKITPQITVVFQKIPTKKDFRRKHSDLNYGKKLKKKFESRITAFAYTKSTSDQEILWNSTKLRSRIPQYSEMKNTKKNTKKSEINNIQNDRGFASESTVCVRIMVSRESSWYSRI